MSHTVHITPKAREEILSISHWWSANRSTEQSLHWYIGILQFIESLNVMPESHSLISENVKSSFETREAYFGLSGRKTHRIIFRILTDTIEVVTVRYLSRGKLTSEDLQ